MKKILMFILLLIMPLIVFADVAGPEMKPFEVEVEKDGVNYYSFKGIKSGIPEGTLPKGTEFKVYSQYTYDGVDYLSGDYKADYIYVKAEDVVAKGSLGVKDAYSTEPPVKVKIDGEVILRKGPSPAYPESGRVKNIETTYTYFMLEPEYIYISYNGEKGWVALKDEAIYINGSDYVTSVDITKSCGTIPANTVIPDVWTKPYGSDSGKISFEYDGCSYMVDDYYGGMTRLNETKAIYKVKGNYSLKEDITSDVGVAVKSGEEIGVLSDSVYYRGSQYYYAEYGNKKGWILIDLEDDAEYIKEVKVKKQTKDKDDDEEEEKADSNTVVIVCVIIAVALAFGALGIILYLMTKKKGEVKNEESA